MELRHILFPVDFSESCTAVADHVEAMVRDIGARLTLLHVLEYPPSWSVEMEAARLSSIGDFALIKERRQEQLKGYLDRQFHDIVPLRLLSEGEAATEIVQYALKEEVSLIMMPTRGTGVFRRLLVGSVTAKVLHDASCPVWTTSHSEHVDPVCYPYRTVACAVDLSERSAETVHWASRFASDQHANMSVVHAIDVEEQSMNRGVLEVRRYLREIAVEKWEHLKKKEGFTAPLHIAYGSTGAALRKAAHDLQADVVIIGRGHVKQPLGRLRTNSYAIIRESPCPVISV